MKLVYLLRGRVLRCSCQTRARGFPQRSSERPQRLESGHGHGLTLLESDLVFLNVSEFFMFWVLKRAVLLSRSKPSLAILRSSAEVLCVCVCVKHLNRCKTCTLFVAGEWSRPAEHHLTKLSAVSWGYHWRRPVTYLHSCDYLLFRVCFPCEWQEPANRFVVFSCFFTMLRIWAFGHARLPQSGIFLEWWLLLFVSWRNSNDDVTFPAMAVVAPTTYLVLFWRLLEPSRQGSAPNLKFLLFWSGLLECSCTSDAFHITIR